MAIANFTGVRQQTTDEQPLCSTHFTAGLHDHLTFISVLNSFLSITAFLGNALVLIALHKVSSLHPPSKLLLRSLAATDLCVGLISEPRCNLLDVWSEWTLEYLSLSITRRFVNRFYFVWGVSLDNDCNERGQTSRPVVGTEIQTSCNFKANLRDLCYHLDCVHCHFSNMVLESRHNLMVLDHSYTTVSNNLDRFLHKDFLHPPSLSKSSTKPCAATEPNKSTEHSAIQKSSGYCNMAANDASRLLSTLWCNRGFVDQCTVFNCLSRLDLYAHFSLLKLVIKPDNLL